jgi:hypothetical protein
MSDPILDAIVSQAPEGMFGEEDEVIHDVAIYGLGVHKGAELVEVNEFPKSETFGYKVGLKFHLKPGVEGGLPYTGRFDLPRTLVANGHKIEDWMQAKEDKRLKFLKEAMSALGFTKAQNYTAIDTDEQYSAIVAAMRRFVGNKADVKVAMDGKNVKNDDGSWTFVPSEKGYTKFAWIKPSRSK